MTARRMKNWRRPSAWDLLGPLVFVVMGVMIVVLRAIPSDPHNFYGVPVSGWGVDVVGWGLVTLGVWALVPVVRPSHRDEDGPIVGRHRRRHRRR